MITRSVFPCFAAGLLGALAQAGCGQSGGGGEATGSGGGATAQGATGTCGTGSSTVAGSAASTGVGGGSGIAPGPVDAVVAQMPPDSWKELPATPMTDVCPTPTDHYACGAVMIAWTNQGRSVSFLDPTTWKWTTAQPTGADPGAGAANGTYGRFRYSSARGVLMLVNTTTTNVFLYKPSTAAP